MDNIIHFEDIKEIIDEAIKKGRIEIEIKDMPIHVNCRIRILPKD